MDIEAHISLIRKMEKYHVSIIMDEEFKLMNHNSEKGCDIILKYHCAGFWSIFNKLMNYIKYYKNIHSIKYDVIPDVLHFYGNNEIFSNVFEEYIDDSVIATHTVIANRYITYEATGYWAGLLHLKESNWRQEYHQLWKKYIILKQSVNTEFQKIKEEIIRQCENKKIISILVRHNSLAHEQPNEKMPEFNQYDMVIQELLEKYNNNVVIILATDVIEAEQYFKNVYNHIQIIHPFSFKAHLNSGEEAHVNSRFEGDQKMAELAVITVMLLSLGDHFIFPNSNMATAALYINPLMKSHFLVG